MKAAFAVCLILFLSTGAFGKRRSLQQSDAEAPAPSSLTATDVLNFALQLEYLEAEFYSCAATGQPIPSDLRGGGPASTGCEKAQLGSTAQAIAEEIAQDEIAHVTFLRQALGSDAVPIPQLNIGSAFAAAANAAFGSEVSPPFSPYLNDILFYHGAFIFEDVGVTAYAGAVPLIASTEYIQPAAQILSTEAYHSGAIRTQLYNIRDEVTPYNVTVAEVVGAISDLRDSVDGDSDDDEGIEDDSGNANIFPVNSNGLVFTRTPAEVLAIVTLGAGPSGGGFYPNGLNGAFGPSGSSQ